MVGLEIPNSIGLNTNEVIVIELLGFEGVYIDGVSMKLLPLP